MSHPLYAPDGAGTPGAQPFSLADNATIDACAQLMTRTSHKQRQRWTRQAAAKHLAALLGAVGAQGFVWRDARGAPLSFVIGRAADQLFLVCELCADESMRDERICMLLLDHVRKTAPAAEIVFDAAQSRRHARQLVRSL